MLIKSQEYINKKSSLKFNMAKTRSQKALVIVESPAKAKTINKYLGPEYDVKASMGHVRDLPSKGLNRRY